MTKIAVNCLDKTTERGPASKIRQSEFISFEFVTRLH